MYYCKYYGTDIWPVSRAEMVYSNSWVELPENIFNYWKNLFGHCSTFRMIHYFYHFSVTFLLLKNVNSYHSFLPSVTFDDHTPNIAGVISRVRGSADKHKLYGSEAPSVS